MSSYQAPDSTPTPTDEHQQRLTPAVQALIAINVAVTFVQFTVFNGGYPSLVAFDSTALPARWFTAFRMFAHAACGISWRTCTRSSCSARVEQTFGTRKFTWFYLLYGLGGVVFRCCSSARARSSGRRPRCSA